MKLVRDGIACLLEPETDWEICGQAANGQEAVEKVRELKPDLVILDLGMPRDGWHGSSPADSRSRA